VTYRIASRAFEGPIDLLLQLVEERSLKISEVSLSQVTEGYFTYLRALEAEAAEHRLTYHDIVGFLAIASTLILVKSRSLLPGFEISAEEEEDIHDLERRLKEYQHIKHLTEEIARMIASPKPIASRNAYIGIAPSFVPPPTFSIDALPAVMKRLLAVLPEKTALPEKTVARVMSLEDKIADLESRIKKGIAKTFTEFVGKDTEKTNVIVSFLALLELVKLGGLSVSQESLYGGITIDQTTA